MRESLEKVETPYVAIQGAADESFPERLEIQYRFLEENPDVGFVGCNYSVVDNDGNELRQTKLPQKRISGPGAMIRKNMISQGEVMFRVSAYRRAGGYRDFFKYTQDWDLWLRMLKWYDLVRLPETLYVRNVDPLKDISGNPQKSADQYMLALFARYLAQGDLDGCWINENIHPDHRFQEFLDSLTPNQNQEICKWAAHQVRHFRTKGPAESKRIRQALEVAKEQAPGSSVRKELEVRSYVSEKIPFAYPLYFDVTRAIPRLQSALSKACKKGA
jgi:hypothetical protein